MQASDDRLPGERTHRRCRKGERVEARGKTAAGSPAPVPEEEEESGAEATEGRGRGTDVHACNGGAAVVVAAAAATPPATCSAVVGSVVGSLCTAVTHRGEVALNTGRWARAGGAARWASAAVFSWPCLLLASVAPALVGSTTHGTAEDTRPFTQPTKSHAPLVPRRT